MKRFSKVSSLLLMSSLLFSCNNSSPKGEWITLSSTSTFIQTITNNVVFPFNTVMTLKYYKDFEEKQEDSYYDKIEEVFLDNVISLHKKMDRHNFYYEDDQSTLVTNVRTINDSYATGEEIICSSELYSLIKLGYQLTLDTNGFFNFFMGGLTSYWDSILEGVNEDPYLLEEIDPYFNSTQKLILEDLRKATPTVEEIENIITFNDDKQSVIFNSIPDRDGYERSQNTSPFRPHITSGGIAKGHATDYLKQILVEQGYTKGFINSGSSSITSLSKFDYIEQGYQNMSITDPRTANGFIREMAITIKLYEDYALSTSANYTSDKSYSFKGENDELIYRHHIINPLTGESSQYHASVSLISNTFTNGQLDAFSTAFVNTSLEDGIKLKNKLLDLYPEHNLDIVIMDIDQNDNLIITVSEELKDHITIEGENCIVNYE